MTSQADRSGAMDQPQGSTSTPGPIAAAVAASANGLKRLDLESALMDASLFGHLAYHAICQLGFEKLDPPKLNEHETQLVYWAISQLSWMVDQAKDAFYEASARKGASP